MKAYLFAAGISGGISRAALVELLHGINWPSLLLVVLNLAMSAVAARSARIAARRERARQVRLDALLAELTRRRP